MSRELLERAREHCFMAGVGDTGAALCEANVPYGLAKIHHVQRELGAPPDATFIGAPDATVTRNDARWRQGFGYGGVYQWSGDFTVLDVKPNACGMSVGTLPSLPALDDLRARLHQLDRDGLTLDGVPLDNDLTESNHFVDVFTVAQEHADEPALGGARHVYIMHSSGHEHRGPNAKGPGLYWDKSQALRDQARVFDTPWGSLRVLEGDAARRWYAFYQRVQDFNHRRREAIADFLFGEQQVIVNATHQGLVRGYDRANIGCYTFDDLDGEVEIGDSVAANSAAAGKRRDAPLFPLTLSPTLPAFLVRPRANVGDAAIDALGWRDRIERHGLADRIAGTNVLPHGGGYTYPYLRGVGEVRELGPDDRRFPLLPADPNASAQGSGASDVSGASDASDVIETPRGLRYGYRGMEVKDRMEALDLGRAVVRLDLEYVLTA